MSDRAQALLREALKLSPDDRAEWRLEPNEALRLFGGLRVLFYQEALVDDVEGEERRRIAVARLVACKGCEPG